MSDSEEEFENWCKESDDGGEERESNSRFHNFAEGICKSYQASIIGDINAQIAANPELVTPANEEQLDRLDKLLVNVECKTHPDAPHGFLRNASHNADRYVCECEHWEEPKMITNLMLMDRLRKDVEELRARIELMEKNEDKL